MLESYEQEIIRKRRAARIFWLLVFSFATFLYFFFQGYYPAFNLTWKQVFMSGGVRELTRDELIRSFGIINVRVYPRSAITNINGEAFGFDEKKMVPYGKYRLSVGKPGYIQDRVRFEINKKTPYFISEIHLIPQARYERIGSGEIEVSKIDETKWIMVIGKTHLLYDKYFLTGSRIPPSGRAIGDGYFLSGTSLFHFGNLEWEKKAWSGSQNLIKTCPERLEVKEGILWCPVNGDALTNNGFLYKKIREIYPTYLLSEKSLFANKIEFPLNEQEQKNRIFLEIDETWYTPNGGLLIPIVSNKLKTPVPLIETGLDTIDSLQTFEGKIIAFGKKGTESYMVSIENDEKSLIPFPNISFEGIQVTKVNGNIFFRAKNALLFLYEGSDRIEWLTEGEILATSDAAGIYKKDGEIWRVLWGTEKE